MTGYMVLSPSTYVMVNFTCKICLIYAGTSKICLIYAGTSLMIGGFLLFMLIESIPAIQFGIILGAAFLALSISSLRSWKNGQPSALNLKGQAGKSIRYNYHCC